MRCLRLLPPAALLLLSVSACESENLSVLTPSGAFDPASLDFGSVSLGSQARLPARMVNDGPVTLTVESVVVTAADFGFLAGAGGKDGEPLTGQRVRPGDALELDITFTPAQLGARQAQMLVNAEGIAIPISLAGIGAEAVDPALTAEPSPLDFGRIPLGGEVTAVITVSNGGTAPVVLANSIFQSSGQQAAGGDIFALQTPLPLTVPAGEEVQLSLRFGTNQEGTFSDMFSLNPGNALQLNVPLVGTAAPPAGDFVCTPAPLEFGQVLRGETSVARLRCTVQGGTARLVDASVVFGDNFALLTPPVPNTLLEGQSVEMDLRFSAEGLPRVDRGQLLIRYDNDNGPTSTRVVLQGQVVPPNIDDTAVSVQLQWDTDQTDLDLHFVQAGGVVFDDNLDCYFSHRQPDWGVVGDPLDDPFLDDDDTNGFGPETINLSQTGPAQYEVYVHYWSDRGLGESTADIQVYLDGQSVYMGSQRLACTELWHVGTVQWDGVAGTFTPAGTIEDLREGRCL